MIRIFYDLETTGLDYRKCSIIQMSGIIERDNEIADVFDFTMQPHEKALLTPEALKINNRTVDEIWAFDPFLSVFKEFEAMLNCYIDRYYPRDKAHLVGFNNRKFDDDFLRKFFILCGNNFYGSYFWSDTIDVSVLASEKLAGIRSEMKNFKLHTVCKQLGLEVDANRLHEASYDVLLTRQAYLILTGRAKRKQ